jgi:tetratricopeptide (TPR) repeat protein
LQIQPPPATPPEADELAGRAQYIVEHAKSADDLLKAADAFEKVALVAPWLPDYYFDAAVAYEKADRPADALRNYKLSLMAYPSDSEDARKVRKKIGALSYVLEQQQAAAQAEQARRDAEAEAERQRELADSLQTAGGGQMGNDVRFLTCQEPRTKLFCNCFVF